MEDRTRSLPRRLRRAARNAMVRPLTWLALRTLPRLYVGYMKLVYATSRVDWNDFESLHDVILEYDGTVGLLWHEEVFTVAYGYGRFVFHPHTLASAGTSGEIITRMLELCRFVVFRGGSTRKASRRRTGVLSAMIQHMKDTREVIYGITVDGSQGPAYRMKPGGALIARECKRPVVLVRTWYKRCVRLSTWDRTAIPLPFNVIKYWRLGPYPVPDDAGSEAGLNRFVLRLEDDLIDLAALSYREMGQPLPANLVKRPEAERRALLAAPE